MSIQTVDAAGMAVRALCGPIGMTIDVTISVAVDAVGQVMSEVAVPLFSSRTGSGGVGSYGDGRHGRAMSCSSGRVSQL